MIYLSHNNYNIPESLLSFYDVLLLLHLLFNNQNFLYRILFFFFFEVCLLYVGQINGDLGCPARQVIRHACSSLPLLGELGHGKVVVPCAPCTMLPPLWRAPAVTPPPASSSGSEVSGVRVACVCGGIGVGGDGKEPEVVFVIYICTIDLSYTFVIYIWLYICHMYLSYPCP